MKAKQRQHSAGAFGALTRYLREHADGRDTEALEALARQLFNRGIPEEFSRQSSQDLAAMLRWVYDFYLERKPGEAKVRVLEPTVEQEGWELPFALVIVATDDKPFLVDSASMALTENGAAVQLVMHPQVLAVRDARGRLQQVVGRDHGDAAKARAESLMLFWVERPIGDQQSQALSGAIDTALQDVDAAVTDFEGMRARVDELIAQFDSGKGPVPKKERAEARAFLEWLRNDHFTFLGYREYAVGTIDGARVLKLQPQSGLGILRQSRKRGRARSVDDLERRLREFAKKPVPFIFTKTDARSTVHRRGHMDYIGVLHYDDDGHIVGESRFIGLYTSGTYHRSAWEIPFIRGKADAVMRRSGIAPDSHDGKALTHILESLPRDELFQSTVDELYATSMGVLELEERNRTRLFVRRDHVAQFFSCLVFIPRERFNTDVRRRVQQILRESLGGAREDFALQFGESGMVRVHFIVRPEGECTERYEVEEIEQRVVAAVRSWHDELREVLIERHGEREGLGLARRFEGAVSASYRDEVSPHDAAYDVARIEALAGPDDIAMSLYRPSDADAEVVRFKVYKHDHTIPLSDAMPMLERMGLRTLSEWGPYEVRMPNGERIWIQDLDLVPIVAADLDVADAGVNFQEAFAKIWRGHAESDGFNRLILGARMTWRQAALLRAYCKYLLQTGVPFSQAYMEDTFGRHPLIARLLVELFEARLEPARDEQDKSARAEAAKALKATFGALAKADSALAQTEEEAIGELVAARRRKDRGEHERSCRETLEVLLDEVASLDEDRILRAFAECIGATIRTNYFQPAPDGGWKDYVSFKFDSANVPDLPKPRPFREVFVYSPRVEGVHLRGGTVARGGLRWSDRREDFRTEILGLMKAQSVKNTLIVPVGAKGGFVPKQLPVGRRPRGHAGARAWSATGSSSAGCSTSPTTWPRGRSCTPAARACATTATTPTWWSPPTRARPPSPTSPTSCRREYGFWLGDAFASGGSNGYDHKGMGITAKGAWESVKRHFRELGIDCQKQEHTAVGVGDMAGDVFGNGMLLSKKTRLVAAFNHLHIFIDPDPDTDVAYKERQRLFRQGRSAGATYDTRQISEGRRRVLRRAASRRIKLPEAARERARASRPSELPPYQIVARDRARPGGSALARRHRHLPQGQLGERGGRRRPRQPPGARQRRRDALPRGRRGREPRLHPGRARRVRAQRRLHQYRFHRQLRRRRLLRPRGQHQDPAQRGRRRGQAQPGGSQQAARGHDRRGRPARAAQQLPADAGAVDDVGVRGRAHRLHGPLHLLAGEPRRPRSPARAPAQPGGARRSPCPGARAHASRALRAAVLRQDQALPRAAGLRRPRGPLPRARAGAVLPDAAARDVLRVHEPAPRLARDHRHPGHQRRDQPHGRDLRHAHAGGHQRQLAGGRARVHDRARGVRRAEPLGGDRGPRQQGRQRRADRPAAAPVGAAAPRHALAAEPPRAYARHRRAGRGLPPRRAGADRAPPAVAGDDLARRHGPAGGRARRARRAEGARRPYRRDRRALPGARHRRHRQRAEPQGREGRLDLRAPGRALRPQVDAQPAREPAGRRHVARQRPRLAARPALRAAPGADGAGHPVEAEDGRRRGGRRLARRQRHGLHPRARHDDRHAAPRAPRLRHRDRRPARARAAQHRDPRGPRHRDGVAAFPRRRVPAQARFRVGAFPRRRVSA
ncbi:MAG: NAD-glutamate dehydrogenase [Halofilum sp. (in: g-proteobacteria)]|nr:NAD-glutamate dehydrogenase [Halofilum sp. (in: g-proteobacteria)]